MACMSEFIIFGNDNDRDARRLSCFYWSDQTGCEKTKPSDNMLYRGVWKSSVCSNVNHAENDQKFYMKAIVVPKNIVASICCSVESGISLAIAVNRRQNGSKEALWAQCGVLDLYRRRRIDFVILREDTDLMSRSIIERRLLNYEFEITYIAAANLILKMFSQFLSGYRSGFPGSCYRSFNPNRVFFVTLTLEAPVQ